MATSASGAKADETARLDRNHNIPINRLALGHIAIAVGSCQSKLLAVARREISARIYVWRITVVDPVCVKAGFESFVSSFYFDS